MIYSNVNHVLSKIESLKIIIEEEKPAVVVLVETKLAVKGDIDIEGYRSWPMNRDQNGGGIIILIKKELKNIVLVNEKQQEVGEIMWITITNGRTNIRLGVVYAPQESETTVTRLKEMYKKISMQIEEAKKQNQNVVLVGDFNCKVGSTVEGNTEKVSKGGKILLEMVNKQNMKIVNTSDKCQGRWTRTDGTKRSILDYVLINNEDEEMVKQMIIDEEREFTPYHIEGGRTIYTDHYSIKFEVNWNMRYQPGENKRTVINEKNNAKFESKTTTTNLNNIWKSPGNLQEKYSDWSQQVAEIAEDAYVQKKKNNRPSKTVRLLRRRKNEINRRFKTATTEEKAMLVQRRKLINEHIGNHRKEENKRKAFKVANKIKSEKGFDGSAFWEFKRRSSGKRKEEMTAIKNEEGELEENPEKILEIYQRFYEKLLTGKEMTTEAGKKIEEMIDRYIELLVKMADRSRMKPFSEDEYQEMKKKLKPRKAPDTQGWRYELIKHAGKDLEESTLTMINELTSNNFVAKEWEEMIIKAIGKGQGKGDTKTMGNKRGLFLTNIISKVIEKLIKNRTKSMVEQGMSPFQCGGVRLRGMGDNLLILNTVIEEFRFEKKDLYILFADLEKCFDKLWLRDSIVELVEAGMPIAEAMYVYKMNTKVTATVETPVGKTGTFNLNEIVRQGTVCAVDICGVSTDKINRIKGWETPLEASEVEIKHPVYVDDMIGMGTAKHIEEMEPKMQFLEESKKYVFNNDKGKTEIMEMGFSGRDSDERERPKIEVGKGVIGYTDTYKCLGDQYDESGRNKSKIAKKMEKSQYISAEVKRHGSYERVGAADTGVRLLLLETVVKPTLLFNTETWVNITNEEMEAIDRGHYQVLRKIFEQKKNTPYYGILMEIGHWPYSLVVVYKRMMYFHHLIHSDDRRIARKLILNQMEGKGKGKTWYEHGVKQWLVKLDMVVRSESEMLEIKKSTWKKEVKEKIEELVKKKLEEEGKKMTKLRFAKSFARQNYLDECRMEEVKKIMKLRLNMVELKANFKGKYENTMCPACNKAEETTEHVIVCPEYQYITQHSLETSNITEKMNDLEWLKKASQVYEQIEETRKWLL